MPDYSTARYHMVECQIRTNNVNDPRLIKALQEVPRELFVPDPFRSIAYLDHDLKIADGRFLMEPMVLARLLQLAEIQPTDIVLDIGCTTGYAAAILARLAATVVALESDSLLAKRATATLARIEADNVVVVEGALNEGYAEQAPYDVIVVGGLVPEISPDIACQLGEGGRLVAVVAPDDGPGRATVMVNRDGVVSSRQAFDAAIRPLAGFARDPGFVF